MQFKLSINDNLAILTELDVLQIQRIAFMQLADLEAEIKQLAFHIEPVFESGDSLQYRTTWTAHLASGSVLTSKRISRSVGTAVLASIDRLQSSLRRRLEFEKTIASRLLQAMRGRLWNPKIPSATKQRATSCA